MIVIIKIIHLFHIQIIIYVLVRVVQVNKMDNMLKILGIIIIEKKCVQMNQHVHHQNHLGYINSNIIKINNAHLNVMKHMLIN